MPVCPQCGRDNAEGARFCDACGARLETGPSATVRKTVTVLFCDLVGSTSIGDRSDPELLRDLMARYHAQLRTILERHGGTVEKFVGDAVMAVFGIPQAREDDALRAVRAAHEITSAVAGLGLEVRTGVNTGEVVAGDAETLVTGDAVNVAARLEQAASSSEILLGEGTHALVRDSVRVEQPRLLALKGKPEPVPAYRLLELLPDVPAFTRAIRAPFVGRRLELATLEDAFARAVAERSPRLATIVGAPGIGKSRLVRELVQRTDARVVVGRCLSYGDGITYWPLAEIVTQVGDVNAALADVEGGELAAERIRAAVGTAGAAATSEEIAWGFRKLFEALARERPLVVVLDDIHWAEETLLDLIEYIAGFAQEAPLFLVCTARPDLLEVRPEWGSLAPTAKAIRLGSLDAGEADALVQQLHAVPEEAKARIVEAAEGNPLFVEQLVAMQSESTEGEFTIPPSIHALLAARIDRLAPGERAVIERASIEGRMFHRGSVTALLPEPARSGVGAQLLSLVRKELVRPDRAVVPGDDGFRFGHILIRDAAYATIPKKLRAELHERFADWLAETLGDESPGELVAYHLEQAHGYRIGFEADGAQTRDLANRAGRLLAEAARRAHARLDAAATRSLLERAIELLPEDDADVPALLHLLASAVSDAGDFRRAVELGRRARAAAAAAGQRGVELRARMQELSDGLIVEPEQDSDALLAEAEAAIEELEELDDLESLAGAWELVTGIAALRSDFELLELASSRRLEAARRAGLRTEGVWAAAWLTLALTMGSTSVNEAIARAEEALAEFPSAQSGEFHLALLYAFADRHDDAKQTIERSRQALLELGQRALHASMSMNAAWIALLAGEPERVEQDLRASAEVIEAREDTGVLSTLAAVFAEVLLRLGRDDEAEEWTKKSELTTPPEDVLSHALWRATRAKVLARRGSAAEATALAAEAVEWIKPSADPFFLGDCLFAHGEVLSLLGRRSEARPVFEEALAVYERKGIVPSSERTRAVLATLDAQRDS